MAQHTHAPRRHGALLTSPSLTDLVVAFFIGNLFANFLLLLVVLLLVARALHLEIALGVVFAAYIIQVWLSKAQYTGDARWPAFLRATFCSSPFNYFDMRLLCDAQFSADQKYIFACAPHGIHGYGLTMLTYEGDDSPFYARFPHLRGRLVGLVASVLFRV